MSSRTLLLEEQHKPQGQNAGNGRAGARQETGSNSSTATRVAGSEPLKISMPMNPLIHPRVFVSLITLRTVVVRSEVMLIADYCTDNRTGQSGVSGCMKRSSDW